MLCWNFYFISFILILCISFFFLNRSFLFLLVLTETIIILLFLTLLNIAVCFNVAILPVFGILLLILGGLELALAFLILTLNVTALF